MKPVSIVVAAVGVALVAGIVWVLGPGARWVLEHVDGVAIGGPSGLVGKDLAAALDAVRGRVLAVATGLAALVAVYYTARNADTARRTFQLGERGHVTDRYGKAVEQLGSAQAPVRLGGLYALEQLAQGNPDPELRQTIVDVICAYLRMPYTLPPDETGPAEPAVPRATIAGAAAPTGRDPREERQVRLTAQRILTDHLRYWNPLARRWWRPRSTDFNARHWADIRLDLTGATLIDFNLRNCRVNDAKFDRATFTGHYTNFEQATFTNSVGFFLTTFTSATNFSRATFADYTEFSGTKFTGDAKFEGATFPDITHFMMTTFTGAAAFGGATFTGPVAFGGATFTGPVAFGGATGLERAGLDRARVAPAAAGVRQVWPPCWRVEAGANGWRMLRLAADPGGEDGGDVESAEPGG
ncbi:pentapeptide repeat-containing protein [Nonomuraea sp. LPB2021202275-12-8]|uniref:pentapeptide repeat-containing protein n=1 Tax=Nonomuraea sp. LPB2021202275-12-8 TaxID=3120159 RepID=UPI00300C6D00